MTKKRCVFCGGDGPFNREHIFPEWIGREFVATVGGPFTITDRYGRRQHPTRLEVITTAICRDCNGGWMSAVEAHTKRHLMPLLLATKGRAISLLAERGIAA
jgi:hypothetical protein